MTHSLVEMVREGGKNVGEVANLLDDARLLDLHDIPFYGEVSELQGVWATGKTLEECRQNLADVVDGWILIRLARGLSIPPLGEVRITLPQEITVA